MGLNIYVEERPFGKTAFLRWESDKTGGDSKLIRCIINSLDCIDEHHECYNFEPKKADEAWDALILRAQEELAAAKTEDDKIAALNHYARGWMMIKLLDQGHTARFCR